MNIIQIHQPLRFVSWSLLTPTEIIGMLNIINMGKPTINGATKGIKTVTSPKEASLAIATVMSAPTDVTIPIKVLSKEAIPAEKKMIEKYSFLQARP